MWTGLGCAFLHPSTDSEYAGRKVSSLSRDVDDGGQVEEKKCRRALPNGRRASEAVDVAKHTLPRSVSPVRRLVKDYITHMYTFTPLHAAFVYQAAEGRLLTLLK